MMDRAPPSRVARASGVLRASGLQPLNSTQTRRKGRPDIVGAYLLDGVVRAS